MPRHLHFVGGLAIEFWAIFGSEACVLVLCKPPPPARVHFAMAEPTKSRTNYAPMLGSVVFFLCAGPVVIFCNKEIMVEAKFHFPLAVSSLGLVTSSIICWTLAALGIVDLPHKEMMTREFVLRKIVPLSLTSAGTIYFGNLAYLYLSVSFVQICKAFGPVITLFFSFAYGLDKPSLPLILSILAISVGTAIASFGELRFSVIGFIIIMAAQACEGIKLVLQQVLTGGKLKLTVWEGLAFMSPLCAAWLVLGSLVMEAPTMLAEGALARIGPNWMRFVVGGLGGFCVNLAVFLVVKHFSALSLKVIATIRNMGIVLVSVIRYGDPVTSLEAGGYAISLVGFALYQYSKSEAGKKKQKKRTSTLSLPRIISDTDMMHQK